MYIHCIYNVYTMYMYMKKICTHLAVSRWSSLRGWTRDTAGSAAFGHGWTSLWRSPSDTQSLWLQLRQHRAPPAACAASTGSPSHLPTCSWVPQTSRTLFEHCLFKDVGRSVWIVSLTWLALDTYMYMTLYNACNYRLIFWRPGLKNADSFNMTRITYMYIHVHGNTCA